MPLDLTQVQITDAEQPPGPAYRRPSNASEMTLALTTNTTYNFACLPRRTPPCQINRRVEAWDSPPESHHDKRWLRDGTMGSHPVPLQQSREVLPQEG